MTIRTANTHDAGKLVALWREAGLRFDPSAVAAELRSVLDRDDLVLVDVDDEGEIAGAVLGTFDGRRGWVNRLAVREDMRGNGVGGRLLAELERRLTALGCRKVNLLIEPDNSPATGFYARQGYRPDDLIFMEKHLAVPSRRELSPLLYDEPYVYVTEPGPPPSVPMFAAILEDEGLTLILTRADADAAGLDYSYVAARITLRVNSALDEVGLTATVSRALADAGISCNVIAASAHDHLFVPWPRRLQARDLLIRLLCRDNSSGRRLLETWRLLSRPIVSWCSHAGSSFRSRPPRPASPLPAPTCSARPWPMPRARYVPTARVASATSSS